MLLSVSPLRFQCYLTGNTETNLIRSEVSRRIRLHQKAETYLTLLHAGIPFYPDVKPDIFCNHREAGSIGMRSLPLFYASREIKELGPVVGTDEVFRLQIRNEFFRIGGTWDESV